MRQINVWFANRCFAASLNVAGLAVVAFSVDAGPQCAVVMAADQNATIGRSALNCGLDCVRFIREIRDVPPPTTELSADRSLPLSLADIRDILVASGLQASIRRLTIDELAQVSGPAVLHLPDRRTFDPRLRSGHFICALPSRESPCGVILVEASTGGEVMDDRAVRILRDNWDGYCVVIAPSERSGAGDPYWAARLIVVFATGVGLAWIVASHLRPS